MSAAVSKLKNQVVISALNADVTIKAGISNASTSGIADNSSVMMQTNVGTKISSNIINDINNSINNNQKNSGSNNVPQIDSKPLR